MLPSVVCAPRSAESGSGPLRRPRTLRPRRINRSRYAPPLDEPRPATDCPSPWPRNGSDTRWSARRQKAVRTIEVNVALDERGGGSAWSATRNRRGPDRRSCTSGSSRMWSGDPGLTEPAATWRYRLADRVYPPHAAVEAEVGRFPNAPRSPSSRRSAGDDGVFPASSAKPWCEARSG